MLAPTECTPNSRPSPLPSALRAAELGPAAMADDLYLIHFDASGVMHVWPIEEHRRLRHLTGFRLAHAGLVRGVLGELEAEAFF
jgi:hypothetical protein